jgi:hypothetical protein
MGAVHLTLSNVLQEANSPWLHDYTT